MNLTVEDEQIAMSGDSLSAIMLKHDKEDGARMHACTCLRVAFPEMSVVERMQTFPYSYGVY